MDSSLPLIPLFFLTALVYSTAGLGGGSTYLALLALFSLPYTQIPQAALVCNLIVVTGGFYFFVRAGHFSLKRVLPFIVTSIPMAYLGGQVPIGKTLFSLLLGFSLLVAALRMILREPNEAREPNLSWKKALIVGLPVGALLGFLSGLVGIGGGIFLSPLLLLMGWADSKQAAGAASFFILVNSISGLAGQIQKSGFALGFDWVFPLFLAVFLGGQIGARLGSQRISKILLQRVTAVLLLVVAAKLLLGWG